jgi:GT2 family glycosyltransferase
MKFFVIILNWNGKNDTLACLHALQSQEGAESFDTVVVDNGSSDDSAVAIRDTFPQVTLLTTGKNLGYAGGNNIGIEYALQQGADLVLLLNNDTIPRPHFISALQQASHSSTIFGAYPLLFAEPDRLDHLGGVWNEKKGHFDLVGLKKPRGFRSEKPLDYVCGCSILIPSAVFKTIGLLEPKFFLFWEEADLCVRAHKAGFSIKVCYEAELLHKVSASFTGGAPHKTYFWWRGRLLWIERNCTEEEKNRLYKKVINKEVRHLLKLLLLKKLQSIFPSKSRKQKLLQYKAAWAGYRDFRKHRFGEKFFQS